MIMTGFRFLWRDYLHIRSGFCYFVLLNFYQMKQIYILSLLLIGILTGCGSNKKDTKAETQRMFQ